MNIGHSSRLPYDVCAYPDKLEISTSPGTYKINQNHMYNCDNCLVSFGRNMNMSPSIARVNDGSSRAVSQDLADLESILTNRNVKQSKCKNGKVNPINVTKIPVKHNVTQCDKFLEPKNSRLDYPAANYRDLAMNRFFNLPKDPQANIFWDFATNTSLEAKDNFNPPLPRLWANAVQPIEVVGKPKKCTYNCQ